VHPDKLSEIIRGPIGDAASKLGKNESLTCQVAEREGIKITVTRQDKITFWQAFAAVTWFPVLVAFLTAYLWDKDQNGVIIHYVRDHLTITATGIFAAWLVGTGLVFVLFRYIRQS
jgi:hypothetical protein